jgi:hypothetical protein
MLVYTWSISTDLVSDIRAALASISPFAFPYYAQLDVADLSFRTRV